MYHTTKGIVLHTVKYSETSVITRIYTEVFGLLSFIVKGVRSSKSKNKASMLQPLTILEMEINYRENKNLQFVKEFHRGYTYSALPFDTLKLTVAMFLLEVISKSVREHETNAEMFAFMEESLVHLDKDKLNPDFHLLFLIEFSRHLGFMPHANYDIQNRFFEMTEGVFVPSENKSHHTMDEAESKVLNRLLEANFWVPLTEKISRAERKALLKRLIQYYQLHIENFSLKSPEVLEEIMG